jgi:Uri superfamily endonuclease
VPPVGGMAAVQPDEAEFRPAAPASQAGWAGNRRPSDRAASDAPASGVTLNSPLPPMRFIRNAAEAPALPGAYLLLLALPGPLRVALPRRPEATLQPGRLLYAGSARGPGGLRARLARHQRANKTPHWHIDRVTLAGTVQGAWIFPGGDECVIIAALAHLPVPLPGFGNTDCRHCASHLLAWPVGTDDIGIVLINAGGPGKASGRTHNNAQRMSPQLP